MSGIYSHITNMTIFKLIVCVFLSLIVNSIFGQNLNGKTYKMHHKDWMNHFKSQSVSILLFDSDSTCHEIIYKGGIRDKKKNYLDWKTSEKNRTCKLIDKNTMIFDNLIYNEFRLRNRCIIQKRFQRNEDVSLVIRFQRWVLEKRPKYKLKRQPSL